MGLSPAELAHIKDKLRRAAPGPSATALKARFKAMSPAPMVVHATPEPEPATVSAVVDQLNGGDGVVVDEAVAREAPCVAYELGTRRVVFSKGIVGALDLDQQALYCAETEVKELSPKQKARLEAFRAGAESCHTSTSALPKGERLAPFLGCLSEELRKRGQEL
jgi:hypothetical protein